MDKSGCALVPSGHKALRDSFDDLFMDFVNAEVALNDDYALWLASGDLAVFVPDSAVKGLLLLFEATFVETSLGALAVIAVARTSEISAKAGFEGGEKEHSQIRIQFAANEPVQREHILRAQFAASALVGLS